MIRLNDLRHSRAWGMGLVTMLLALLIFMVFTGGPTTDDAATTQAAGLPQPVLDSLSKKPVWCYADYQDRLGRNNSLGYYPTVSLDEALYAPGAQRWMAEDAAKQYVRCYTSWQAAFHHQDGRAFIQRSTSMQRVQEWLPDNANEADYEIALLYGLFRDQWQEVRDPAFSPSIRPHRWVLTEDLGNTLTTQ